PLPAASTTTVTPPRVSDKWACLDPADAFTRMGGIGPDYSNALAGINSYSCPLGLSLRGPGRGQDLPGVGLARCGRPSGVPASTPPRGPYGDGCCKRAPGYRASVARYSPRRSG